MSTSLVNNRYRITRRIGGGSFGEIYLGIGPSGERVAVKFERHGSRCPQLRHEYKVYREVVSCHGFCRVHHFGTQDNYNVMVMDLLGPSLEDLFNRCSRRFSLKTVLQLADQMLERVDTLHSRHLIHRDIKPANFVIGTGDTGNCVFVVDFGLSKRYRHPKSLQHIPHRDGRSLTGTPRYASINNHLGIEQSRRDDLESIGYVLVYFLKGSLPWQGLKAKNAQKKYQLIMEKKQHVSIANLCQGCPSQFAEYLSYCRSLKFDSKPDITYLRKLFRDLYHAQGCSASTGRLWDWDSVEADNFIVGGTAAGNSGTGGPANGGPAGFGTSGGAAPVLTNAQYGDVGIATAKPDEAPRRPPSAQTGATAVISTGGTGYGFSATGGTNQTRAGTALSTLPAASAAGGSSSWGFNGSSAKTPGAADAFGASTSHEPLFETGKGVQQGAQSRTRPHTAGAAARAGSADEGEDDDGHVVAGARAMMRYRRQKDGSEGSTGRSGQGQPTGTSRSGGWGGASGAGAGAGAPAIGKDASRTNGQGSMFKSGGTSSTPALGTDTMGRPKSANATGATSSMPVTRSSSALNNPDQFGRSATGASAAAGATSNSSNGSNSLSYGALKNRFLSGSKNKSKLFTLGSR